MTPNSTDFSFFFSFLSDALYLLGRPGATGAIGLQGLGKTVQTIAFCAALLQKTGTPQDSIAPSERQHVK